MGKGFKVLLLAEEDPELRNYIKNIVKERIKDVEQEVLVEVVSKAFEQGLGKLGDVVFSVVKDKVGRLVDTIFGWDRYNRNLSPEMKTAINAAIVDKVNEILTPTMVQTIVREEVRKKVSDINNLIAFMEKK